MEGAAVYLLAIGLSMLGLCFPLLWLLRFCWIKP